MDFLLNFNKDEIKRIIKESSSGTEVLNKMGVSHNGGYNRMILSHFINENEIDISHFKKSTKWKSEEIYTQNSVVSQRVVRKRYKEDNFTPYECAICGLPPFWNGKELTLTLDHINGDNSDNRVENLRWVCPNCDRQLSTFGSKNRKSMKEKQAYRCKVCGKELKSKRKTGMCQECYRESIKISRLSKTSKNKYKDNKDLCPICNKNYKTKESSMCLECSNKMKRSMPPIERELLKELIRKMEFTKIAEMYDVSDNTIRKWCDKYNLPRRTSDIKSISDKDWELI